MAERTGTGGQRGGKPRPGVGMPQHLWLLEFGDLAYAAFGAMPYHVGSSLTGKRWRDVDVRVTLSDEQYAAMELGDPAHPYQSARWVALTLAFASLGHQMTGLPVDFQIQQQTHANATYDGPRSALVTIKRGRVRAERSEVRP